MNRSPGYPLECVQDFVWPDTSIVPPLIEYAQADESIYENKSLLELKPILELHLQKNFPELVPVSKKFFTDIETQRSWETKSQSKNFKKFKSLSKHCKEIAEDGSSSYELPFEDIKSLKAPIENEIKALLDFEGNNSFYQYDRAKSYNKKHDYTKVVESILIKNGLIESAKDYFGYPSMSIATVTLHVAMPGDLHLKQVFCDTGYSTDLSNLHFDPKAGTMKCIIYLDDVGLNDGPFCYIPKSHRHSIEEDVRLSAKANCTGNYLDSPAKRKFFMQLPKKFRNTSIYGPLCVNGSEVNKYYHEKLTAFTSNQGNAILFDPATSHVGGVCKSGRRINLQIAIRK